MTTNLCLIKVIFKKSSYTQLSGFRYLIRRSLNAKNVIVTDYDLHYIIEPNIEINNYKIVRKEKDVFFIYNYN
jgi:hypothetical protein